MKLPTTEVWLVTYGPGDIYWQRFGHNGIWIRDPDLGLDHIFNFGYFDFEQEDFFTRFLLGRMLYFSAAQRAEQEFAQYIDANRSIRLQKLALSPTQALSLADALVRQVQPENRDYLYDYYQDNCATRVRDAIDQALGGPLRAHFSGQPAAASWRDHTRSHTEPDYWLHWGLELVLGRPVDRPIDQWQEFFIPSFLADAVAGFEYQGMSLVTEDVMLHRSSLELPDAQADSQAWRYAALAGLILLVCWLLSRRGDAWSRRLALGWMVLGALAGSAMVFFWFGTDHQAAGQNLNLLLFNPLWLLALVVAWRRGVALLVTVMGVVALLQVSLPVPPGQYTVDVVALLLPLNLAAAWSLWRSAQDNSKH